MLGLAPLRSAPLPIRASATACGRNTSQQLANGCQLSLLAPEAAEGDTALPENMHKWRMVIAYDGTKFKAIAPHPGVAHFSKWSCKAIKGFDKDEKGAEFFDYPGRLANLEASQCWQYQPSIPTIQYFLEDALICITKLDRKKLCLVGAGRTDTGVHAWGQVAHFTTPFSYSCLSSIHSAMNGLLPPEIRVREISAARPEFHARSSTKSKVYRYKIYNEAIMDPFHNHYAYHSAYKLNPHAMQEAANYFVGIHDFTSFANAAHNDGERRPTKKITRFDVTEMGAVLQLEVEGTGFLYRQVRNMVALLLQVGKEALPPDIVPAIIAARDRKELAKVALSAPPHGLYLMSVNYDEEILKPPEGSPPISFGRTHHLSKCKLTLY
ncbi:pseudouridylate synthase isoform X1 [Zea mays]|nr:pseudouridylate synthase isoform X1 [Zea mays]|eukprot:XP_008681316.1 pseudouridylate synthase isoform X1 [Zea mays]